MFPCERSFSIWKWQISSTSPPSMFVKIKNGPMPSHFLSLKIDHFIKIAPHKISNDVNRNPREAQRKKSCCMFDMLIYIAYTYIHHSRPREARRKFCTVRLTWFVVFKSILSIHTITPISSARSAEKIWNCITYTILLHIVYTYHYTSSLPRRAQR